MMLLVHSRYLIALTVKLLLLSPIFLKVIESKTLLLTNPIMLGLAVFSFLCLPVGPALRIRTAARTNAQRIRHGRFARKVAAVSRFM